MFSVLPYVLPHPDIQQSGFPRKLRSCWAKGTNSALPFPTETEEESFRMAISFGKPSPLFWYSGCWNKKSNIYLIFNTLSDWLCLKSICWQRDRRIQTFQGGCGNPYTIRLYRRRFKILYTHKGIRKREYLLFASNSLITKFTIFDISDKYNTPTE